MIYVKDYRNLNEFLVQSQSSAFYLCLQETRGKTITVFTSSGGASGKGFTGMLTEVSSDSLQLLSQPSSQPQSFSKGGRKANGAKKSPLATQTIIKIEHIVAISIPYI